MDSSIDPLIRTMLTFGPKPADALRSRVTDAHFQNELAALLAEDTAEETTDAPSPSLFDLMPPTTPGNVLIPPGNLAALNNNPGNLRFARQYGAAQGSGGFAQFSTPEAGYQALVDQVQLDASRGETLAQYITKYAPPSENDTALYIRQASETLGVHPNTPLASIDSNQVAAFQARKESGATIRSSHR